MEFTTIDSPKVKRAKDALARTKTYNPIKYVKSLNDLSIIREEIKKEKEISEIKKKDLNVIKDITKKTLKKINKSCNDPEVFELTKFLNEEIEREIDINVSKDSLKFITNIENEKCGDVGIIKKTFKEFVKKSDHERKNQLDDMKALLRMNDILIDDLAVQRKSTVKNDSQLA